MANKNQKSKTVETVVPVLDGEVIGNETLVTEVKNAYHIAFSYIETLARPGVITIPASNKTDAEAKLRDMLIHPNIVDIKIVQIEDIKDVPSLETLMEKMKAEQLKDQEAAMNATREVHEKQKKLMN